MDTNTAYDNFIASRDAAAFERLRLDRESSNAYAVGFSETNESSFPVHLSLEELQQPLGALKAAYSCAKTKAADYTDLVAPKKLELEAAIAKLRMDFEAENIDLLTQAKDAEQELKVANDDLREFVVHAYEVHGEKTIDSDCSVRINTALNILDKSEAIKWAKENAPILLTINESDFKKFPKIDEQPFIEKVETATAVIKKFEA